jgi:hypothetical protein
MPNVQPQAERPMRHRRAALQCARLFVQALY